MGNVSTKFKKALIQGDETVAMSIYKNSIDIQKSLHPNLSLGENYLHNTPLHYACKNAMPSFVKFFLEDFPDLDLDVRNSMGQTVLHVLCQGSTRTRCRRHTTVPFYPASGGDMVGPVESPEARPHNPASCGGVVGTEGGSGAEDDSTRRTRCLDMLLDQLFYDGPAGGCHMTDGGDEVGLTVRWDSRGYRSAPPIFGARSASPPFVTYPPTLPALPLTAAIAVSHPRTSRGRHALSAPPDPESLVEAIDSTRGWTALHYAAWAGNLDLVRGLVERTGCRCSDRVGLDQPNSGPAPGQRLAAGGEKKRYTPCDLAAAGATANQVPRCCSEPLTRYLEFHAVFLSDEADPVPSKDLSALELLEPYTTMSSVELLELKDQLIVETSDMLGVPLFTAEGLLRNYEWSRAKLLEAWIRDPVTCCRTSGVQSPVREAPTSSCSAPGMGANPGDHFPTIQDCDQLFCGICEETFRPIDPQNFDQKCSFRLAQLRNSRMDCDHTFCHRCWESYLTLKIQEGNVHAIMCPAFDCHHLIPVEFIERVVSREMAKKYLQYDIQAFVESNPTIKWCPHPGCTRAVKFPETNMVDSNTRPVNAAYRSNPHPNQDSVPVPSNVSRDTSGDSGGEMSEELASVPPCQPSAEPTIFSSPPHSAPPSTCLTNGEDHHPVHPVNHRNPTSSAVDCGAGIHTSPQRKIIGDVARGKELRGSRIKESKPDCANDLSSPKSWPRTESSPKHAPIHLSHHFCWDCSDEAHAPCACESWRRWARKLSRINPEELRDSAEQSESAANRLWLVTNSKPCPHCKSPIQKNEGCNHMRCYKCKFDFCWICLDPWKKHSSSTGGYFRCHRYEATQKARDRANLRMVEAREKNEKMQELNRFVHHYTKFNEHEHKLVTEESIVAMGIVSKVRRLASYGNRHMGSILRSPLLPNLLSPHRLTTWLGWVSGPGSDVQQVNGSIDPLPEAEGYVAIRPSDMASTSHAYRDIIVTEKGYPQPPSTNGSSGEVESPSLNATTPPTNETDPGGQNLLGALIDPLFLYGALEQLLKARRVCRAAVVYGYYLPAEESCYNKTIFEFMQNELEEYTENLSRMINSNYLSCPRVKIIQMTHFLNRKRQEFLAVISSGLVPAETPPLLRKFRRKYFPNLMDMDLGENDSRRLVSGYLLPARIGSESVPPLPLTVGSGKRTRTRAGRIFRSGRNTRSSGRSFPEFYSIRAVTARKRLYNNGLFSIEIDPHPLRTPPRSSDQRFCIELDPANPWVKDDSGRHSNLVALYDWPDCDEEEVSPAVQDRSAKPSLSAYDGNVMAVMEQFGGGIEAAPNASGDPDCTDTDPAACGRTGCRKRKVKNPRTGVFHGYCSFKCSKLDKLEQEEFKERTKSNPDHYFPDLHIDMLRALEMSRLQHEQDLAHAVEDNQSLDHGAPVVDQGRAQHHSNTVAARTELHPLTLFPAPSTSERFMDGAVVATAELTKERGIGTQIQADASSMVKNVPSKLWDERARNCSVGSIKEPPKAVNTVQVAIMVHRQPVSGPGSELRESTNRHASRHATPSTSTNRDRFRLGSPMPPTAAMSIVTSAKSQSACLSPSHESADALLRRLARSNIPVLELFESLQEKALAYSKNLNSPPSTLGLGKSVLVGPGCEPTDVHVPTAPGTSAEPDIGSSVAIVQSCVFEPITKSANQSPARCVRLVSPSAGSSPVRKSISTLTIDYIDDNSLPSPEPNSPPTPRPWEEPLATKDVIPPPEPLSFPPPPPPKWPGGAHFRGGRGQRDRAIYAILIRNDLGPKSESVN